MDTAQEVTVPTLTPVESSMIKAIGYDAATCTLWVQFNRGQIYSYTDVPLEVHQALMAAESHGKYFHKHIRGEYAYARRDKP